MKRGETLFYYNHATEEVDTKKFKEEIIILSVCLAYYLTPVRWIRQKCCGFEKETGTNHLDYSDARRQVFSTVNYVKPCC